VLSKEAEQKCNERMIIESLSVSVCEERSLEAEQKCNEIISVIMISYDLICTEFQRKNDQ
jgi:hypothetical protein